MNHDYLVERGEYWLKNSLGCNITFNDKFRPNISNREQPDVFGIKSGKTILLECKSDRKDFLKDKNKKVRKMLDLGMGDFRYYLCPPNVILPDDISNGFGLLYCYPKTIRIITGQCKRDIIESNGIFNANKQAEGEYLTSALRRIQLRDQFNLIYEKLDISSMTDKYKNLQGHI